VLRIGYGIFYNPTWTNTEAQYSNKPPWVNRISLTPPASTADPWANFPGGNPFPSPSGDPGYVFQNAGIFSYAEDYTEPQMQQWNVNLQRELAKDFLFTAAYVGTKGTHLMIRTDKNAAVYIPGQSTLANLNARGLSTRHLPASSGSNRAVIHPITRLSSSWTNAFRAASAW